MLSLPHYAKIKDNYCIAYFGHSKEYIIQLKLLRPIIEAELPGIKVFIACRNESMYLLQGEERILSKDKLPEQKSNFSYIRELSCNMETHPIEDLMKESDLPCGPIYIPNIDQQKKCVLLTNGILPTRSLTAKQIQIAINFIKMNGYPEPEINGKIETAGWIIGVENEDFYKAAAEGRKVTLIPTGLGGSLFKSMFPKSSILPLMA